MSEQACPYCGSTATIDCGDIGRGERHFECKSCRCGFPWNPVDDIIMCPCCASSEVHHNGGYYACRECGCDSAGVIGPEQRHRFNPSWAAAVPPGQPTP